MALGLNLDDAADAAALRCRRFWLPRGISPNLLDLGFLVDPETSRNLIAPPAVSLDELSDVPVLALLGEPGLGKTTVFNQETERLTVAAQGTADEVLALDLTAYATDFLVRQRIIESKQFRSFRGSTGSLFLLLDGLDTSIQHVETVVALLLDCLQQENCERLFLRITCRAAAWPPDLEKGLKRLWPKEDAIQVFELAPLRRDDVRTYAEASGVPGEVFLKEVERVSAHQFANRPISLRFLLKVFRSRKELPSRKTDLYREGCLVLCDEERADLRRMRRHHKLSSGLRLAVAARLAAVNIFCSRTAIWTASRGDPAPEGDARIDQFLGGQERFERESVAVEDDGIRETVDTGLFRSIGLHRIGFSHQTYAEYLAARYLVDRGLPIRAILRLIQHPDGSGKVIPRLRETVAWLAALVPEICANLLSKDPTALFASDTFPSSNEDRRELLRQILRLFDARELFDLRMVFLAGRQDGARLKYPGMADDLRPYIVDHSHGGTVRLVAIMIAQYARQTALDEDVLRIALDSDERLDTRVAAAFALRVIGSESSKVALKPLVGSLTDDPTYRLKGAVLAATWPECLTAEELFEALTLPKNARIAFELEQFLRSDFPARIPAAKLPLALTWAREHLTKSDAEHKPLGSAALSIVAAALDCFHDPQTVHLLAGVFVRIVQVPIPALKLMVKLGHHREARRAIGLAAVQLSPDVGTSHALISYGVVEESDVEILFQDLEAAAPGAAKQKVAILIAEIVCSPRLADPTLKDRAFAAAKDDLALAAALRFVMARRAKWEHQTSRDESGTPADPSDVSDSDPALEDRIDSVDIEDPMAFAEICQPFFVSDWDHHQDILPGWQKLSPGAQARIVHAAEGYLRGTPVEDDWIETQLIYSTVTYGYWALRLLRRIVPAVIDDFGREIWEVWMPCVFGEHYQPEAPDEVQEGILKAAYRRAPYRFREVLARFMDAQNRLREEIHILDRTTPIWDHEIADLLRARMQDDRFSPHSFRRILAALISAGDADTFLIASEIVTAAAEAPPDQIEKPIQAALELVTQDPSAAWKVVWPVVQKNGEFAGRLFSCYAIDPQSSEATLFLDGLGEHQLAEWYIWLSQHAAKAGPNEESEWRGLAPSGFEISGPTRGWYWLSTTVLNALVMRGTPHSLAAIRFIDENAPDENLKRVLVVAEEFVRQKTWVPLSPFELLDLIATQPEVQPTNPQPSAQKDRGKRSLRYEAIDKALTEVAKARPHTQEEVFQSLQARKVVVPDCQPFKMERGWTAGFQRDKAGARAWLSKRWALLNLPSLPRGPKK